MAHIKISNMCTKTPREYAQQIAGIRWLLWGNVRNLLKSVEDNCVGPPSYFSLIPQLQHKLQEIENSGVHSTEGVYVERLIEIINDASRSGVSIAPPGYSEEERRLKEIADQQAAIYERERSQRMEAVFAERAKKREAYVDWALEMDLPVMDDDSHDDSDEFYNSDGSYHSNQFDMST